MRSRVRLCLCRLLGAAVLLTGELVAQTADTPPVTLHVYTDLLQIPVLVLDRSRHSMVGLAPRQFRLSVDAGPSFQPPYVRREGDDPIALTVFVDANVRDAAAEARLASAVGALAPSALNVRDSVGFEAVHTCGATRTEFLAVTSATALQERAATVLKRRDAAPENKLCGKPKPLWDMVADACVQLGRQQGRRVLLVISDGADYGSQSSLRELRHLATERSVAIFVVTNFPEVERHSLGVGLWNRAAEVDALQALSQMTGGVSLPSSDPDIGDTIKRVVSMVRERYIVEFARPRRMELGAHDLEVRVARPHALVRAAGISFPQMNAAQRAEADALQGAETRAPEPGTRRILNAPR